MLTIVAASVLSAACLLGGTNPEKIEGSFLCTPVRCSQCGRYHLLRANSYQPQAGDLMFFTSGGPLKMTVFVLTCSGPPTHVGIVVCRTDGTLGLLEAVDGERVSITNIEEKLRSYPGCAWVRRIRTPLAAEQSTLLTTFAENQVGKPYDFGEAVGSVFGPPTKRPRERHPGTRGTEQRWFCSELAVVAGIKAKLLRSDVVLPRFTDPEDMFSDRSLNLSTNWARPLRWSSYAYRTTQQQKIMEPRRHRNSTDYYSNGR